jgi:transposase
MRFLDNIFIEKYHERNLLYENTFWMDNASIHKSREILELIEKSGCRLLCQPPFKMPSR